jgi:TonB family protein
VPNPPPATSATAAPVTVAEAHEDGIGNFSENYPAQVDPQARGSLFVGVAGSVVLRVDVDETGRVTAIAFIRAPADPALKDALRTRLLATRFIPAACNGLRCSDTIELHN